VADFFLKWWAAAYSNPTPAEAILEPAIAKLGHPYRFQHPIWAMRYRVDYAFPKAMVIFEVDDPSHRQKAKRAKDKERTARLESKGWKIYRCTNEEALADPEGTVTRLATAAGLLPHKEN
jgi:very-short-patch-repair endonuclease